MEDHTAKLRDILADNQVGKEDIAATKEILTKMIEYLKSPVGTKLFPN
jgi:hypothetical protein